MFCQNIFVMLFGTCILKSTSLIYLLKMKISNFIISRGCRECKRKKGRIPASLFRSLSNSQPASYTLFLMVFTRFFMLESLLMAFSITLQLCMMVVWSLPPKTSPICGRLIPVISRVR